MTPATRVLRQSEVTLDMSKWASGILADPAHFPLGAKIDKLFGVDHEVEALVEWHTYQGRTGKLGKFRGVSLFGVGWPALAAPHDADFSPNLELVSGIDVSHFQAGADWKKLAAGGIDFAFIKATEGLTITDQSLSAHFTGAGANGILRGPYHFFRVGSDPKAQVRRFLEESGKMGSWQLPPVLDVEPQHENDPFGGVSASEFADHVAEAVEELARQSSKRPIVYTGPGFWNQLPSHGLEKLVDLWLAEYTKGSARLPANFNSWLFWQFTDQETISGYPGHADANRFAGTLAELKAYADFGVRPSKPVLDLSTLTSVQHALNKLGSHIVEDGLSGPATTAAVRAFQSSHGLTVDGLVGPATRAALVSALG